MPTDSSNDIIRSKLDRLIQNLEVGTSESTKTSQRVQRLEIQVEDLRKSHDKLIGLLEGSGHSKGSVMERLIEHDQQIITTHERLESHDGQIKQGEKRLVGMLWAVILAIIVAVISTTSKLIGIKQ